MEYISEEPCYDSDDLSSALSPESWYNTEETPGNSLTHLGGSSGNPGGGSSGNLDGGSSGNPGNRRGPLVVTGGGFSLGNRPSCSSAPVTSPMVSFCPAERPDSPAADSTPPPSTSADSEPDQPSTSTQPLTKRQKANRKRKLALQLKREQATVLGTVSIAYEKHIERRGQQAERRARRYFSKGILEAGKAKEQESDLVPQQFASSSQHQQTVDDLPNRVQSRQLLEKANINATAALKYNLIGRHFAPSLETKIENPTDYLHHIVFRK